MAKNGKNKTTGSQSLTSRPASAVIGEKGVTTNHQFALFMSALMSDLVSKRIEPQIANAACNAGGKLLRVVELTRKASGSVSKRLVFA